MLRMGCGYFFCLEFEKMSEKKETINLEDYFSVENEKEGVGST